MQIQSNLDLTAARVSFNAYAIRFESRSDLKVFDEIFGKYACFVTSEPKPTVSTLCTKLSLNNHVYTIGRGLFQPVFSKEEMLSQIVLI